ncbi:MAG: alpha/beta hydrolase [Phenylobacterium sp.]|nr:alpha/beta hydrolase [Phenylobacterium sp.]
MLRTLGLAFAALVLAAPAAAQVTPFPADFRTRDIATNGATIHVRVGGHGPAVVLLHGYGDTGDMWAPMAAVLEADHTVIVPDLRGLGLSSKPASGFDKKTQAGDVAGVMDALGVQRADLVTHDIGNMVGFAFAAQHPDRVRRFRADRRPGAGRGALGGDPQEPLALALPLRWPGHGAAGGGTRADLSRPLLE